MTLMLSCEDSKFLSCEKSNKITCVSVWSWSNTSTEKHAMSYRITQLYFFFFFSLFSFFFFLNTGVLWLLFLNWVFLPPFPPSRIGIWHGTQKIQTSPSAFRTQSWSGSLVFTCGSASQRTFCIFVLMTGVTSKCQSSTKPKRYVTP